MVYLAVDLFVRGIPLHTYSEVPLSYLHVCDGSDVHLNFQRERESRSEKEERKKVRNNLLRVMLDASPHKRVMTHVFLRHL
jgi:hypothetical protein